MSALPLHNAAFAARVQPFLEARVLDLASAHVVDLLAHRAGVAEPEVLLALAFAVRAPGVGHVGVDLATVDRTLVVEEAIDRPELRQQVAALSWPADRAAWWAAVQGCALVSPDGAPFVAQRGLLMPHRTWDYQRRLGQALLRRAEQAGVTGDDGVEHPLDLPRLREDLTRLFPGVEPGDRQRLGALSVLLRKLAILSGGPGTGKTWTVRKVLALLWSQWDARVGRPPRVALAAPTGKAAVRMRQALLADLGSLDAPPEARDWLRGLQPATLHRLLGFLPATPTRFRHGAANPLELDVLVVDEASMVDLALMCKLVEAVPPHARLVLLGDRNQLASVEAGSVLADITHGAGAHGLRHSPGHLARLAEVLGEDAPTELIDPGAPPLADGIVHFVKPYRAREGSGVQAVAYAIADGRLQAAEAWLAGEAAEGRGPFADLGWHEHRGRLLAPDALEQILQALAGPEGYLARLLAGPAHGESREAFLADVLRRLESVRVLCAHREGSLGVSGLNEQILAGLTEGGPGRAQVEARGLDWHGRPVLVTENSYEVGLMNGDVGVLVRQGREVLAVFPGEDEGTVLQRSLAQLPQHQTVFAMTVHKSQGSEFAHTFLVLPAVPGPLLTRELIYTGLTRARGRLTVCGSREVLTRGLGLRVPRASALGSLLWEGGG